MRVDTAIVQEETPPPDARALEGRLEDLPLCDIRQVLQVSAKTGGAGVGVGASAQHAATSTALQGRNTRMVGIARRAERCSTGGWVGPSSPRPIESWVIT